MYAKNRLRSLGLALLLLACTAGMLLYRIGIWLPILSGIGFVLLNIFPSVWTAARRPPRRASCVASDGADLLTAFLFLIGLQVIGLIGLAVCRSSGLFSPGWLAPAVFLAADTLVCVENEVLGKPADEADAARMIRLLSGKSHWVYTGVCLLLPDGSVREEVCGTEVCFAELEEEEILRYAASGEPLDKAGAYAVQGRAGAFVRSIHGSPTNVIGLPLETVARMLREAGWRLFD